MDANVEDKIVHQIEQNLSNNINDNLFSAGKIYEDKKPAELISKSDIAREGADYSFPQLSRAEYIRQAREACLRQMNTTPSTIRGAGNPIDENEILHPALAGKRKSASDKLIKSIEEEEDLPYEIAAFRSLIIRTVCAVVIFLSVFIMDRFKLKWGDFSFQTVEDFIRGKDTLVVLEDLIVSWLK